MNRRSFLTAAAPAALLAACAVTKNADGTKTVTVNVAVIDNVGQAVLAVVDLGLQLAGVTTGPTAPAAIAAVKASEVALSKALADFDTATHGTVTFTLDNSRTKALAETALAAGQQLLTDFNAVLPALQPNIGSNDFRNVQLGMAAANAALMAARLALAAV